MTIAGRLWGRIQSIFARRQRDEGPAWVRPANAVTRAIARSAPVRAHAARRPLRRLANLDDYPALARALDELEKGTLRPPRPASQAPGAEEAVDAAPRPRPARHAAPVSTRSARRRRHHAA